MSRQCGADDEYYSFLPKKAKMSSFIKKFDWSATPVGPIKIWPQNLRTALNMILNSKQSMALLWGDDGRLFYNDSYAKLTDDQNAEQLGVKAMDSWISLQDSGCNIIDTCYKNSKTLSIKNANLKRHQNGVSKDYLLRLEYSPISDENAKTAGVLVIALESCENTGTKDPQYVAHAKSYSEREKLLVMLEEAPALIALLHGPSHIVTFVNREFRKAVGDRTLTGKLLRDVLPEFADGPLPAILANILKTGESHIGQETKMLLRNMSTGTTETHYFDFIYQPVKDEKGKNADIYVHAVDVTDHVRVRRDLAKTKRMFNALFDSSTIAIARADFTGMVHEANKEFHRLFGYSKTDFVNGITSKMITPVDNVYVTDRIYATLRRYGEAEPIEKRYIRKDGSEFPALVGAVMLPGSNDQFLAFILDISEIERLKVLNKAKDDFVALASHQLRTPATAVKQYIGMLTEGMLGELDKKHEEILKIAHEANDRQLDTINSLLKTAQIDTSVYQLVLDTQDFVRLVKKVLDDYRPMLANKRQTFVFSSNAKLINISLDEMEMSICLANLIENASKYSPENTVITIKITSKQKSVRLNISDQGVGIAPADQDKIFEKFTCIDNELSDTVSGNGLGLYWVKRIVELHHGTLTVESELGKGTNFIMTLPL